MIQSIDHFAMFGSNLIIPFLSVLGFYKMRIFPVFAVFMVLWLISAPLLVGGGVTPMGPGDAIWPDERRAWLSIPIVSSIVHVWLFGLAIGVPLLVLTWFYEYTRASELLKRVDFLVSHLALINGVWQLIMRYLY